MQPFAEFLSGAVGVIFAWLRALPETLVGVVIGSFFTLAGVVLTNRTNLKNSKLQLVHDREQKAKERALSMRRDVYLDAAEALSAGISTLVRHGDLSLTPAALMEDYKNKSGSIAKVHVIASERTALRFVEFVRELSASIVKLTIQRNELVAMRSRMLAALEGMKKHHESRDKYVELLKLHHLDGSMDERRFKVLDQGFQFEQSAAERRAREHDSLLEELRPKHLEFVQICQRENARLAPMLLPLIESIREDLEQPINIKEYEKVLSRIPSIARDDLESLFGARKDGAGT